jgi:hypothetical protein
VRVDVEEGRVIGCLIEKQLTTPQQYPLTVNALLSACNQSSNRDPVVVFDERIVEQAVVSLKDVGLVHFVHPSHGRSVTRYAHALHERLDLDDKKLALVAVLLLRGPQTAGELRARTERMTTFDGIAAVDAELDSMRSGSEPLVLRLPRRPGQKEERWEQLLASGRLTGTRGDVSDLGIARDHVVGTATSISAFDAAVVDDPGPAVTTSSSRVNNAEELATLANDVAALRLEVAELRAAVEHLGAEPRF